MRVTRGLELLLLFELLFGRLALRASELLFLLLLLELLAQWPWGLLLLVLLLELQTLWVRGQLLELLAMLSRGLLLELAASTATATGFSGELVGGEWWQKATPVSALKSLLLLRKKGLGEDQPHRNIKVHCGTIARCYNINIKHRCEFKVMF